MRPLNAFAAAQAAILGALPGVESFSVSRTRHYEAPGFSIMVHCRTDADTWALAEYFGLEARVTVHDGKRWVSAAGCVNYLAGTPYHYVTVAGPHLDASPADVDEGELASAIELARTAAVDLGDLRGAGGSR